MRVVLSTDSQILITICSDLSNDIKQQMKVNIMSSNQDASASKRRILNKAKSIDQQENLRLLQLFIKHGVRFTENMNGCFIDLTDADGEILNEVEEFLDMCIEVHAKNEERNAQIKQYTQEFEQYFVPVRTGGNGRPCNSCKENEFLNVIKNDKTLNSLEKSIMKENLKFSQSDSTNSDKLRKSITPKYNGLKARLLKNCRTASRNVPAFNANSLKAVTERHQTTESIKNSIDNDADIDVDGDCDDLNDEVEADVDHHDEDDD